VSRAISRLGDTRAVRTIDDVLLPNGTNVNQTPFKEAGAGSIATMRQVICG